LNLAWTLHRLSAMSTREIGYRVRQQVRAGFEQFGLHKSKPPTPRSRKTGHAWTAALPVDFDVGKYRRAADAILAGEFQVFAMRPAQLGFPPQWNRDPKTGRVVPLSFGKALNYRDEALVGDIKYLWEPSRHAELVTLAQAWRLTRDFKYAQGCRTLLDSWFEQCPWPLGVHWTSSLEHAVRLINWSFAWQLLGADQSPLFQDGEGRAFRARWLNSIYQHSQFIANHFSRFSSANNHLLGELTGLYIASLTWPMWARSERWRDAARREIEREAAQQNFKEGVNREQANWYHHEVADMLLLAGLVARANGQDFSTEYWQLVHAMVDYVASIMDSGGNVPNFGDADDAVLARLDPAADFDAYKSLLAAGALLFDSPGLKHKAGSLGDKARWLLGDDAARRFDELQASTAGLPIRRNFDEAGYYVLGDCWETPREVRIVADAGPLGYLSIAAHGHADALSFTLSAGGRELLIDPGTFAYHTQKQWRDYFRGTAAHNTIRIDGEDQSVSGGNFLWRTHANACVANFSDDGRTQRLVAEHDGYTRYPDAVRHRRELRFERLEAGIATLTVIDDLLCQGAHEVELCWHFSEHCEVTQGQSTLTARNGASQLTMQLPASTRVELRRGSESPPFGWISRSFDARTPSPSALARCAIKGNTQLVTVIQVEVQTS
jgi:hypothetical protein